MIYYLHPHHTYDTIYEINCDFRREYVDDLMKNKGLPLTIQKNNKNGAFEVSGSNIKGYHRTKGRWSINKGSVDKLFTTQQPNLFDDDLFTI